MSKRTSLSGIAIIERATATSGRKAAIRRLVADLRDRAMALGHTCGVKFPPYDPSIFAKVLGAAEIRKTEISVGGRINIRGDGFVIELNKEGNSTNRWRFILAHEVAHLALWDTERKIKPDAKPRRARSRTVERLCDDIAIELLAPQAEIRRAWKQVRSSAFAAGKRPDLVGMIRGIAEEYRLSLQTAALRFVEICSPRSGVALFSLGRRSFYWSHFVPDRNALIEFLLLQYRDWLALAKGKTDPLSFCGATTAAFAIEKHDSPIPVEWKAINPDLCLVVINHR